MSARPLMRLASPTVLKSPTTPRSILRRPAELPLSPSALSASFSIHVVSPPATSPHVRFPTSAKLTSTFFTHSPNTYDRAAITVSPNSVARPADALFSLTTGVFKNQSADSLDETYYTPITEATEFKLEPPPTPAAELTKPAKVKQSRASLRFQQTLAAKKPALLPREDLGSALLKFPRSPYPTADASTKENVPVAQTVPKTTIGAESSEHQVSLARRMLSPVEELPSAVEAVETTDEDRLSQEFWRSVTLEQPHNNTVITRKNDTTPSFIFGSKDGALWSPGLPRRTPLEPIGLSSMLSPLSRTSFAKQANPQAILSPTPNDPFSAFPSFTAVLSTSAAAIAYPPRAVVEH